MLPPSAAPASPPSAKPWHAAGSKVQDGPGGSLGARRPGLQSSSRCSLTLYLSCMPSASAGASRQARCRLPCPRGVRKSRSRDEARGARHQKPTILPFSTRCECCLTSSRCAMAGTASTAHHVRTASWRGAGAEAGGRRRRRQGRDGRRRAQQEGRADAPRRHALGGCAGHLRQLGAVRSGAVLSGLMSGANAGPGGATSAISTNVPRH